MRIDQGAKVRTKDGHGAGHVKQAIWDPRTEQLRGYVITTGGLVGHDVVISPEIVEGAKRDGDEVVLSLTKKELDGLARHESTAYAPPPADWRAPSASGFPSGGYLWPVTEAETAPVDDSPPSAGQSRGPQVTKST